jgi:hypothetical protein
VVFNKIKHRGQKKLLISSGETLVQGIIFKDCETNRAGRKSNNDTLIIPQVTKGMAGR